jgi:hypothetical protein
VIRVCEEAVPVQFVVHCLLWALKDTN